jgi:hypothetical protein
VQVDRAKGLFELRHRECLLTKGSHMISLDVLYPNKADAKFDLKYYLETHVL